MPAILIVDDEPDLLSLLEFSFQKAGYEVLLAASGAEALERLKHYVTKPFSVRELLLRVHAVLRRAGALGPVPVVDPVGPLRVDVQLHRAFVGTDEIALTALEFRLLTAFMSRVGKVQSRETLLADVWEVSSAVETRTVDTHVKRLRDKLGIARDLLETVRGVGYRLVGPSVTGTDDSAP